MACVLDQRHYAARPIVAPAVEKCGRVGAVNTIVIIVMKCWTSLPVSLFGLCLANGRQPLTGADGGCVNGCFSFFLLHLLLLLLLLSWSIVLFFSFGHCVE